MNKLIKEISAIVSQYGVDIVIEERFVNILKDLYPDRDNPEKFEILRVMASEGISSEMIATINANNAKSKVEKQAKLLSAKYGYNQQDISQVLYCLCIGCNCISIDDYNATVKPNRPKPSPSKPTGKPKPTPAKPQPKKPTLPKIDITIREFFGLLFAFIGLFATPFAYMALLSSGWWPFWAIVALAVLHFFTIFIGAGLMDKSNSFEFRDNNSAIIGALFSVIICTSFFVIIGPFFCDFTKDKLSLHYGYYRPYVGSFYDSESPTILTFILGLIHGFISAALLSAIYSDHKKSFLYERKLLIKGAVYSFSFIALVSTILFIKPYIEKHKYDQMFKAEKERVVTERQRIAELKTERSGEKMDLSFMDFYLGQDFKQSLTILNDVKDYHSVELCDIETYNYGLIMDSLRYDPIINQVVRAITLWDNTEAKIYLFSNNEKLVAIEMTTSHDIDSIVAIYSEKYGEPEYEPKMEVSFPYYYGSDYIITKPYESTSETQNYSWTFMNSQIRISSSSTYSDTHVLYIDHECEVLLGKWVAEQAIKRQEQQRKEDSIARQAAEAERQRLNKERLEKKQNHEKSIKQI